MKPIRGAKEHAETTEAATGTPTDTNPGTSRPWHLHPYYAVALIVGGVALGVLGVTRFVAAGSEGDWEEAALEGVAALEAEEAGLRADAEAVRTEIESTEASTAGIRDELATLDEEIAAMEAGITETETETAETEGPIRALQQGVWGLYGALQRAAEMESRVALGIEAAVVLGNQRDVHGMSSHLNGPDSTHLANLEDALSAINQAIADIESMLVGVDTSFEITESFEGETGGWEAGFDSNGVAGPADGGYFVTTSQPLALMWGMSSYEIADVTVEVTAQATAGDAAGQFAYGVLCRAEEATQYLTDYLTGYVFAVTGQGGYLVGWYEPPPGAWVDLAFGQSAAVNGGLDVNQISVTCSGSDFSFTINGFTVWEGSDSNLTTGSIALAAWSYDDEMVTVRFDDLRLTGGGTGEGGPS